MTLIKDCAHQEYFYLPFTFLYNFKNVKLMKNFLSSQNMKGVIHR